MTPKTSRQMYKYLDKVLTVTVKKIYTVFRKYRGLKFDELNVLSSTTKLYEELVQINLEAFRDIAKHYFEMEPHGDGMWMYLWLEEQLRTPSPTIKYSYNSEVTRKRDRLAEALTATEGSKPEFDKAMRYWTQMTGWFGIEVADEALRRARVIDGVTHVIWVSQQDDRVCDTCHDYNGMVFPIEEVPPKPHPGCRCYLVRYNGRDKT